MSNYGAVLVWFYNASLARVFVTPGGTLTTTELGNDGQIEALSGRFRQPFKRIGWGSFRVPPAEVDANYPLIQVGNIAVMHQVDPWASATTRRIGAFTIKTVRIVVEDKVPMLEISGPGLEDELARCIFPRSVGDAEYGIQEIGINFGVASEYLLIDDSTNFEDGDDLMIRPTDTGAAKLGISAQSVLWRGVQVGDPEVNFYAGTWDKISVDPPIPFGGLGYDYYLISTDYRTPTTSDVDDVIDYAGWELTVQGGGAGTQPGTSHPAAMMTVFDLLNSMSDITGEWWRPKLPASGTDGPLREIEWRQTSDNSGITLVMPSQVNALTRFTDDDYGIIESFTREYDDNRVGKIYATGGGSGGDAISLLDLPDGYDVGAGWTLTRDYVSGVAALAYNATVAALAPVVRSENVSFPNISPEGISEAAREQTAIQLLDAAKEYLLARNEAFRFYNITAVCHRDIQVGQTINFVWSDDKLTLDKSGLYVVETNAQVGDDGVYRYGLVLCEVLVPRIKGPALLLEMVRSSAGTIRGSSSAAVGYRTAPSGQNPANTLVTIATSDPAGALTLSGQALSFRAYANAESGSKVLATDAQGGARLKKMGLGTAVPDTDGHLWLTGDLKFDGEQTIGTLAASKLWVMPGADLELKPAGDVILQPQGGDVNLFAPRMTFNQAATVSSTAGNISLLPAADLILDPVGDDVLVGDTVRLQNNGFSAGFLGNGWRIDGAGNAEFRTVTADELHVTMFTFEHAVATGRSLWITPGASKLTRDFTTPASIGGTATMYVEDIPGAPGVQVFPTNSYVMLRYFRHDTDGHFELYNVWGQVSGYVNLSNSSEQSYTFTLRRGEFVETGADSSVARSKVLKRGDPVLGFGASGDGYMSLTAADHESDPNSPNMRIMTWATNPYTPTNRTLHALIGNLKAATGTEEYGLFAGDGTANDDPHVIISGSTALINNIPFVIEDDGVSKIKLDPSVPSIAVGASLPNAPDGGGDGFWVGLAYGAYKLRIGGTSTSGLPRMVYDGDSLQFRNGNTNDPLISFDDDGSSYFGGEMTIGTNGKIVADRTYLNSDGLNILANTDDYYASGINWFYESSPSTHLGKISFSRESTTNYMRTYVQSESGQNSFYEMDVKAPSNKSSTISLIAYVGSASNLANVYISSSSSGPKVDITGTLRAKNGLTLGSVTATPEYGLITFPSTGGTGSDKVANPPSGTVKLFEYGDNMYFKTASGNVYRLDKTAI
jgi:hypothetical protein